MTNRRALTLISGIPTEMASTDTILGNVSGSAATVTQAAQAAITSLGTLTGLTQVVGTGATTAKTSSILYTLNTAVANGTTVETDLINYSLLANTLITVGQSIIYEFSGIWTNSINAKTLKFYFGGTLMRTDSLPTAVAGTYFYKFIIKKTSLNNQSYSWTVWRTNATSGTAMANGLGTMTETETADIAIRLTGTGGASAEINANQGEIRNGLGN